MRAFAADNDLTFGAEMSAIGYASFLWVFILSFVGGMANNYRKIAAGAVYTRKQLLSDIFGSVGAGLFTFFVVSMTSTPALGKAAAILIAGFGGAAILERALARRFKDDEDRKP